MGISLSGDRLNCVTSTKGATGNISTEILHTVNLILLQKFYDMDNDTLDAETLLSAYNAAINSTEDLELPLFSEQTNRILASDKQLSYSLNHIVAAMANETDHISYDSAEARLLDYIRAHPTGTFWEIDWWRWNTWGIVIIYAVVGVLAFYCYRRSRADSELLRQLTVIISGSHLLTKVNGYEIKRQAATEIEDYDEARAYVDAFWECTTFLHVILIMMIVALMLGFIMVYLYISSVKRRSFVYMDIGNTKSQVLMRLTCLPTGKQNFTLNPTTNSINFKDYGFFSVVRLDECWSIKRVTSRETIKLPQRAIAGWWKTEQLRAIVAKGNYTVVPLLVHTHAYEYIRASRGPGTMELTMGTHV
jgi:hypothetical protein